ncbi:MAG TPA: PhoU domain-containing protein [Candidatus Nanopelagicaceae bacterium]|nr:PhoU domain-containing protein [Candidatus Nanopelagicaceae bacterium]
MKQKIDLMIDLAYSAIKFSSKEIADETSKIEKRIHELTFLLNVQIIQTQTGGFKEAKALEPIVVMGYSIDKISDALADIARVVYINSDISDFTQLFWDEVPEPIVKITVNDNCEFIGLKRKDIHFRSKHGVDLIAIKRKDDWLFGKENEIQTNDTLIIKGELKPLKELKILTYDSEAFSFDIGEIKEESDFDLKNPEFYEEIKELKKDYVLITDISETMIELALAALFFNSYEVAEDVLEMESLMDGLNINFEKDLLNLTKLLNNPKILTGIMRIIFSCELISDAAAHLAENILEGFEPHIILQKAIEETSEIVVRETISADSYFKDKTYKQLQNQKYKRGFHIIALKRKNKWIYSFNTDFLFEEGDLLIGLGPKETVDQWRSCVHPNKLKDD